MRRFLLYVHTGRRAALRAMLTVLEELRRRGIHVEQGRFGAMMKVTSVNEGPFTVLVEA